MIPPLITIQMQMASLCEAWDIPYLNLSDIPNKSDVESKIEAGDPKIILSSIEDISNPLIQSQLQTLDVSYVAIDEAQVQVLLVTFSGTSVIVLKRLISEIECASL